MIVNEWSESGLERFRERAERLCLKQEDRSPGTLGVICLNLEESGTSHVREADGRHWTERLRAVLPDEKVWFGDRLSGHLWLFAEVEEPAIEAAEARLAGLARRLRSELAGSPSPEDEDDGFGVAAVALSPGDELRDALYRAAVGAVGRMRRTGAEVDPAVRELRRELERLLRERSIRSVFQPIMRIATGEVFGYEALTRCPSDSRFDGPLSLFRFAEREGSAFALDRLAREKAIRSSPRLSSAQKIFINVTIGIMNDPRFVSGQTVQWLRQRGLHPGQVVLELTERSSIDDFAEAKKVLRHYREQGYEIAIDDAGAGYSSLQWIVELRPDYIKVDKSLVQHADRDEMKQQMLRTFIRFARRMNIRTVAEGIERPEELRLARTLGVDFGQGYLLGRPGEYGTEAQRGSLEG